MTKKQKADALLSMALSWQNGKADDFQMTANVARIHCIDALELQESIWWPSIGLGLGEYDDFLSWASAALSEVAALGFDIVDAATGE